MRHAALQGHLHRVFGRDPGPAVAFRLPPEPQSWVNNGTQITLTAGSKSQAFNLDGNSVYGLYLAMQNAGFALWDISHAVWDQAAGTLIAADSTGAGDQVLAKAPAFQVPLTGQSWQVTSSLLRITDGGGQHDFPLAGHSVYGLYEAVLAEGLLAEAVSDHLGGSPATALLAGSSATEGAQVSLAAPAFRVPLEAPTWTIDENTLTLTVGQVMRTLPLEGSIAELYDTIDSLGYRIEGLNADVGGYAAEILLPASSADGETRIHAATALLPLYLHAVGTELATAQDDLTAALSQLNPRAATGEWADLWSVYFGVPRRDGEADADYTARIFREVVRPRVSRGAIEGALGEDIAPTARVFEPWTRVLHPSGYTCMPSQDRLRSPFWTHGTLEISGCDRALARPLVERYRAGGVLAYYRDEGQVALDTLTTLESGALGHASVTPHGGLVHWLVQCETPQGGQTFGNERWTWHGKRGAPSQAFQLAGSSLYGLYLAIQAAGFGVSGINQRVWDRWASSLLPGSDATAGGQVSAGVPVFTASYGQNWAVNGTHFAIAENAEGGNSASFPLATYSVGGLFHAVRDAGFAVSGLLSAFQADPAAQLVQDIQSNGGGVRLRVPAFSIDSIWQNWVLDATTLTLTSDQPAHSTLPGVVGTRLHGSWGFDASASCPEGAVLHTQLRIAAADAPSSLYLGWRMDGDWYYAYWGDATTSTLLPGLAEPRTLYRGDVPEGTADWLVLDVPVADFGLDGEVCDGVAFATSGGHAKFGPSGVLWQAAPGMEAYAAVRLTSSAGGYVVDGQRVVDLYTAEAEYTDARGWLAPAGYSLFWLHSRGAEGSDPLTPLAGHAWRLGDLIRHGYLAGDTELDLSEAIWTYSQVLSTQLTQIA